MNARTPSRREVSRRPWVWVAVVFLCVWVSVTGARAEKFLWFGKKDQPTFKPLDRVTMYDPVLGRERGLRVAVQPIVTHIENIAIDRRLTKAFQSQLRKSFDDVVTVLDIEDVGLRDRLNTVLQASLKSWKTKGSIDPKLFDALRPALNFDMIVLTDRTRYEQAWNGKDKIFRVELLGAAFGVSSGEMLWQDRSLVEETWDGFESTVLRAENQVTYDVAAELNSACQAIAKTIRESVAQKQLEQTAAAEQAELERLNALDVEDRKIQHLIGQANQVLQSGMGPTETLDDLLQGRDWLAQNLTVPGRQQNPDLVASRTNVQGYVQKRLDDWKEWYAAEQARVAALPKDTPLPAPPVGPEDPPDGGLRLEYNSLATPKPEMPVKDVPRPFALTKDQVSQPVKPSPTPTRMLIRAEEIDPPTPTPVPTATPVPPEVPPPLPASYFYPGDQIKPVTAGAGIPQLDALGNPVTPMTSGQIISPASLEAITNKARMRAWTLMAEQGGGGSMAGPEVGSATGLTPGLLNAGGIDPVKAFLEKQREERRRKKRNQNAKPLKPLPTPTPEPLAAPEKVQIPPAE